VHRTHLAMTEQQQRDFDERGFILIEDFFSQSELHSYERTVDRWIRE